MAVSACAATGQQNGRRRTGPAERQAGTRRNIEAVCASGPTVWLQEGRVRRLHCQAEQEGRRFAWGHGPIALTNSDMEQDPAGHRSGFVSIVGRPNAGKSTLLNALVGQKLSITSPAVQTTRRRILGIVNDSDFQAVLVDTPGVIEQRRNRLEGRMMAHVAASLRDADAVVAVVDAAVGTRAAAAELAMLQPPEPGLGGEGEGSEGEPLALLVVLNKVDKLSSDEAAAALAWWQGNCRCDTVVLASALEAINIELVREWIVAHLPEGPTLYPKGIVSEQPERFFVAELLRCQAFKHYRQDVPYCLQVQVVEFKERHKGKDYIACEIICEKESQKGIVLGTGGRAVKALAEDARADIEDFLGREVYLDVKVRVEKKWRMDTKKLKAYGY